MTERTAPDTSLFKILLESKACPSTIVDHWIDSYKENNTQALFSLMQLFIDASGCNGTITSLADDFTNIIRELTENFNEVCSEYPLIQTGPKWKTFKTNLSDFISNLIKASQNSILYDSFMMPHLISLLTGLTDSQVRAFRHTSTFAVMKLMSALVGAYITMQSKQAISRQQYEIEQAKPSGRRTSQKIEHLSEFNKEMEDNTTEIGEMLTYLFKAVFVLRFRDSFSKIRALCIYEIGIWMRKLPQLFLDDSHLKYLGWSLFDKASEVRLISLLDLIPLFETYDSCSRMEFFVYKFKDRIVSMAFDVDRSVAIEAVRVISVLIKDFNSIFTTKDLESIYQLVYSSDGGVAQAAGAFLSKQLESAAASHPIRITVGRKVTANTFVIKELVDFFIESELHQHAAYLVDSLLEYCNALKDWESMTNLLDECKSVETLTPKQESALIDIMVCCVNQATTGVPPFGRSIDKKIKTVKNLKRIREIKEKITDHFSGLIPRLLNIYSSEPCNLLNLLQIPLCFDLSIFLNAGQSDNVTALLNAVKDIFEKYHDTDILQCCVDILCYLSNEVYMLTMTFESLKNSIIEYTIQSFCSSLIEWSETPGNTNEDLKFSLINSSKKVSLLFSAFNLTRWNLGNTVFKTLEQKASDDTLNFPGECISYLMSSCYFNILWEWNNYEKQIKKDSFSDTLDEFKTRFQLFMDFAEFTLKNGSYESAEEAYRLLCDLIFIFSDKSIKKNANLQGGLFSASSRKIRDILCPFLQHNVLVKNRDPSNISALYERRVLFTSYCKLFLYKILPVYFISDILLYYTETYNDFGDIMDMTIIRACELDIVDSCRGIMNTLMSIFENAKSSQRNPSKCSSDEFKNLKKMSKKLAYFLRMENESDVFLKALHTEGILFALRDWDCKSSKAPCNVQFFEFLLEFSHKLSKSNKLYILNLIHEKVPLDSNLLSKNDWQPLNYYKKSLE